MFAHAGPLLELALFAPAFAAVGWTLVRSRRGNPPMEDS